MDLQEKLSCTAVTFLAEESAAECRYLMNALVQ
jgi:hypothetical protein